MFQEGEKVIHKKIEYTVGFCTAGITKLKQGGKRVKCVLTDTVKSINQNKSK